MHCISDMTGGFCGTFMPNIHCGGNPGIWRGLICQIKIKLTRNNFVVNPEYNVQIEGKGLIKSSNTEVAQTGSEVVFPDTFDDIGHKPLVPFLTNSEVDVAMVTGTAATKLSLIPIENTINMESDSKTFSSVCDKCGETFKSEKTYMKHKYSCKNRKAQCKECPAIFGNKKLLKEHAVLFHKSLDRQCSGCKQRFAHEQELEQHLAATHATQSETCSQQDLEDGETKGREESSVNFTMAANEEGKWRCVFCNKVLSNKANLQQHMQTHTATEKVFKCEQCGAKFAQQLYLRSHVRRVHCPAENCRKCGALVKRDSMRKHILRAHGKSSRFRCSICYEEFENNGELQEHKQSHKVIHQCELCGKTYDKQSALRYHMEWHAEVPQYDCDMCDKKFYVQSSLRKHKNAVHAPSRDFKCEVCGKAFKTFAVFKNHREIHSNERKHKCKVCGKGFNSSGSLVNHRRVHAKEWKLDN